MGRVCPRGPTGGLGERRTAAGRARRLGARRGGRKFGGAGGISGRVGIIGDSGKLSLYDSSHLTAVVPAGKLGPGLLNFTLIIQARDCSWHVR